jgi:hypothetical protein
MPTVTSLPDLFVASDAAGALVFGALCCDAWCYGTWPSSLRISSITVIKLFPVVIAAYIWGVQWVRFRVEFLCDNEAVVAILNSGTWRDPFALHLIRRLTLLAYRHNFSFSSRHVPGCRNECAEALSRFNFQAFRRWHPSACANPTSFPPHVLQELLFVNYNLAASASSFRVLQSILVARINATARRKFWQFVQMYPAVFRHYSSLPSSAYQLM